MLQRAYSLLTVKGFDPAKRTFTGLATSPKPDRLGDTIDSKGVSFKNPLPLLLYHDNKKPVGEARFSKATPEGVTFSALISTIDRDSGVIKERLDEAVDSLAAKPPLIRGVSIGFRPLEDPVFNRDTGGLHFPKVEVVELSMVVIPAHQDATIDVVKSLDAPVLAALGTRAGASSVTRPCALGDHHQERAMTISEQLTTAKAELRTKSTRLEELMTQEQNDGGLAEAEMTESKALTTGVKSLVDQIDRWAALEAAQMSQASIIAPRRDGIVPAKSLPTTPRVEVKNLPKGTLFTRYAMAIAAGRGSFSDTLQYAKRWEAQTPEVVAYIKAVEGTVIDQSPGWGSELAYPNITADFLELLMPKTIIGRITGFNMTPFNVRILEQISGSTVDWVGEAGVKPVGELDFDEFFLKNHKIAGIVVLSDELIRLGQSAEERVRNDLTKQISKFMDEQFVTTSITATSSRPASVTNGVSATSASGTTADALYVDLNTVLAAYDTAEMGTETLVIVTTPSIARGLSTLRNAFGQPEFPAMNPNGGTLLGYPVVVSGSVPTGLIIFIKANDILMADDGRVTLDASNQATLDMSGGSSPAFNLWQRNCTGIRAERWITWLKARAEAVQMISGAAYGPSVGSP